MYAVFTAIGAAETRRNGCSVCFQTYDIWIELQWAANASKMMALMREIGKKGGRNY